MKAAALALLLLAPMAGAFPSVTFSGSMDYAATDEVVMLDGAQVLNGTGNLTLPVPDGVHSWSITAGNVTVNGTTVALNVSALLQAVARQAATDAVAGVPEPDLSTLQAIILAAIEDGQARGFATPRDVDDLAAELRAFRTKDNEANDERFKELRENMDAGNGLEYALLGLVLVLMAAVAYREFREYQDAPKRNAQDRAMRLLMLQLGITDERELELESQDSEEPDEPNAGVLVA